jgi:hypothetical protein
MLLEPVFALVISLRRGGRAWRSEDVGRASLSSLSLIVTGGFLDAVAVFVWRVADNHLQAASAACGFVGVLLGAPAVIAHLGFNPKAVDHRRVAVANHLRRLGRRSNRLFAIGMSILAPLFGLAVLHARVPRASLPLLTGLLFAGMFLATIGVICSLLPRRFLAPVPDDVEVLSPLALMQLPRAEAICGLAGLALIATSQLLNLAGAT